MKIIKKGVVADTIWKKVIICTGSGNGGVGCKSKLEINEFDIYYTHHYDYGGGHDVYHTIQCPVCNKETDINDVPASLGRFKDKKEWLKMQITKPQSISLSIIEDFPKKGVSFKDISPLLANPQEFKQLIDYFADEWKGKISTIGAFDARGFLFASALAYKMELPFFMLRKKGKLPGNVVEKSYGLEYGEAILEMKADAVKKGDKVLLIDDVLATGGTALAGCSLVEQMGGVVAGVQVVLEVEGLGGRELLKSYDVQSVICS